MQHAHKLLYMAYNFFLYLMVFAYMMAGINHFWHPAGYVKIMPSYIPLPAAMVAISGICELLFALLLLPETTRSLGAWLIIALLIAVFPANIQMAINFYKRGNPYLWIALLRLPLQFVLIWWARLYTHKLP